MSGILITGTSGFIGRALAESMSKDHEVFCISRQETEVESVTTVQGDFTSPDDLQKLNPNKIDVVVHLAAVTGGGSEAEQLRVNVIGTHQLVRYFVDGAARSLFSPVRLQRLDFSLPYSDPCSCRCPMNTHVLIG